MTMTDPWGAEPFSDPPEFQHHFSHGVTGIGQCARCGDIRTLFTHSFIHTTSQECDPICATCVASEIERSTYDETYFHMLPPLEEDFLQQIQAFRITAKEVLSEWLRNCSRYQHTREEILAHPSGCQACARFGRADQLTRAQSIHDRSVVGTVHLRCAEVCSGCDSRLYSPYSRGNGEWSGPRVLSRVYTARRVQLLCTACSNEYPDLQGCERCGTLDNADNFEYYNFLDESVCRSCQENITTCNGCNETIWCDDSDHECNEDFAPIKSFDWKPRGGFTFHGSDENNVFMGFELEVEASYANSRYDGANRMNEILGKQDRGFLKSDGSLEDGFEIVTQPHTLSAYMEDFPWTAIAELRDEGFRSWDTDTCGFHIHISRKAFGWSSDDDFNKGKYEAHLLRFTKLIYDNQRHVSRYVAGRNSNRWAAYTDKGNLTRKIKTGYQSNSRYSAVNVANRDTIEIRVFKGSLRVERLKAYIQFVHSITQYTRVLHVSPNENNLLWRKYTGWLRKNEQEYPELVSLITTTREETEEN